MDYYINVRFGTNRKTYYFSTTDENIKNGDYVIVDTVVGREIGQVVGDKKPLSQLSFSKDVKQIFKKATPSELALQTENTKLAKVAKEIFEEESKKLNLDMRLLDGEYTLDKTKILFTYVSADRVDFREFLKVLSSKLHCRIELKQINPRERAQNVGGIGICGLPLCCTTFLKQFDSVTLTKAKNQMLSINIPKLSGQCGKLKCCLKFEDDTYTKEKEKFPKIGSKFTKNKIIYHVTSYNIFSRIIKLESENSIEYMTLSEVKKLQQVK